MAITSVGQDLASSITGNVESAYITIHDFRKAAKASALKPGVIKQALTEGTNGFSIENAQNKRFRVQFNPSELQIYSTTDSMERLSAQRNEGEPQRQALVDSPVGARMELSTNLIFDHMNVSSSFMMNKSLLPTSVSGISNIATLGMDKNFSVQPEVEGFISALRNLYTQLISFQWADFCFTGTLLHVGAQYTMFSSAGTPVRAKVSLRVRQERSGQRMQSWFDDFEAAFGGDESNLVRAEQSVSNLINFNL